MEPIKPEWREQFRVIREKLAHGDNATQKEIDKIRSDWEKILKPNKEKEMEDFALVNSRGETTSIIAQRWLCHLFALRHRCSHVLLQWESPMLGNVLILQVQSWDKSDSPGHIDISAAGHVRGDETHESTAYKEMEEELGITEEDLRGRELVPVHEYLYSGAREEDDFYNEEWRKIFAGEITTEKLAKIKFTDKEVVGLYFCPAREARNLLKQWEDWKKSNKPNKKAIPIASTLGKSLDWCLQRGLKM